MGISRINPIAASGLVPVLTYHSQNIFGNDYASNNRHALASDVEAIGRAGMKVISLSDFVHWLDGNFPTEYAENSVVLTSDDAPLFDYEDVEYAGFGMQSSTRAILQNSSAHITLFAIASARARQEIGEDALGSASFMSDHWWAEADASPWASIENHGWDHCHPAVSEPVGGTGTFFGVCDFSTCDQQVSKAADSIAAVTGRRPEIFAYPYGESSEYLRNHFLPACMDSHGMRAAVSTIPDFASRDTNRWDIPRFVCGRDWNSAEAFEALLLKAKQSW
jgi:peptidoglycan/xylan/chitin deacetylase (PgdA/CDA1 family)